MDRRQFIGAAGAGIALTHLNGWAQDSYPARPVKLIVPFPPGGPTDVMGRTAAKAMGDVLGQSFVVENKAGAAGNIGTDAVAKAAPDGHTIGLSAISSLAIAPHLMASVPFNVDKDFAPISLVGTTPCAIVVHPSAPFSDLKGLVAYAKANPGKLAYASSGIGTSNHLAAELLQTSAGIDLLHIPYKGAGQAITDALGGQVNAMTDNLPSTLPHIKDGKLRPLAVLAFKRADVLPDVPTYTELGFAQMGDGGWFGLVAPAGTPRPIIDKLNAAAHKAMAMPDYLEKQKSISGESMGNTPEEFAKQIKAAIERYTAVAKRANIKLD